MDARTKPWGTKHKGMSEGEYKLRLPIRGFEEKKTCYSKGIDEPLNDGRELGII